MQEYALSLLGRAVCDVTFSEMSRPYAHAMAVTLAAQGAEIALKARIAEQHPLLVFSELPKTSSTNGRLSVKELFSAGRTYQFADLPERLWATTGHRMGAADRFREFGKLRNQIMHFAVPATDLSSETLRFIFEVVEPLLNDFWDESVVPYAEQFDEAVTEGYLQERLKRLGIKPGRLAKAHFDDAEAR